MSIYEPLRDGFRELNRMLIDKQQWDAKHELDTVNQAINNKMIESQMQDQELRREVLKTQAVKAEQYRTPQVLNITGLLGENSHLLDDDKAMEDIRRTLDDTNQFTWSKAERQFVDDNGEPIRMSAAQLEHRLPAIQGMMMEHEDRPAKVLRALQEGQVELTEANRIMKTLKSDPYRNVEAIANQKEEIKDIQDHIAFQETFFEPENLIGYYDEKQQTMRNASLWAQGRQLTELATHFDRAANNFATSGRTALDNLLTARGQTGRGTWSKFPVYKGGEEVGVAQMHSISGMYKYKGKKYAELPEGLKAGKPTAPKDIGKAGIDFIESDLTPKDQITPLMPEQNAIAAVARNRFVEMNTEEGPVKNYAHARMRGKKAVKDATAIHEAWLGQLHNLEKLRDDGEINEKQFQIALKKYAHTAGTTIGYVPVMEYYEQIRQAGVE